MASSRANQASGSAYGEHDLRRRNVSEKGENGSALGGPSEVDEKKEISVSIPVKTVHKSQTE